MRFVTIATHAVGFFIRKFWRRRYQDAAFDERPISGIVAVSLTRLVVRHVQKIILEIPFLIDVSWTAFATGTF